MGYLSVDTEPDAVRALYRSLEDERFLFDLERPSSLELLRGDILRIARDMDTDGRPPPMFWSGIPLPPPRPARRESEWCLTISVGGTNTSWLLARLRDGEVFGLDPGGDEVTGDGLARARKACARPTPTEDDTENGLEMIGRIVDAMSAYLEPRARTLERTPHVLLSWGFANRVVRTGDGVLGGLTARTTLMTKGQAGFTEELRGRDVGELFASALGERLGWERPVTVANDGVMALHYFLAHGDGFARAGLFVNGTGANFATAEPYAVRPEGVVTRPGDEVYEPRRLPPGGQPRPGETVEPFIVNYETGSIELDATKTRIDLADEYPIEANALSGGNAFEQQFRELVGIALSRDAYSRLVRAAPRGAFGSDAIEGPQVSRMASSPESEIGAFFPGVGLDSIGRRKLRLIARVVVARSALHAALILSAVTRRLGFGLGGPDSGRPDLLGTEGSVWRTEGYTDLVREYWQTLVGADLSVELRAEKNYAASSSGPLWLTILQGDGGSEERDT